MAALRTGKIDVLHNLSPEDAESMMSTSHDLLSVQRETDGGDAIYMRTDKADLPFDDIKVRQALMMATDFESIRDQYYGGNAQILTFPVPFNKEYADAYLSLEEAPDVVKELYVHNPQKARQYLADAGYPEGFKTTIICRNTTEHVEYLSIIKDQWGEVGVELELLPQEPGAYNSFYRGRKQDALMSRPTGPIGSIYCGNAIGGAAAANASYVDDPVCNEARDQMRLNAVFKPAEADSIHKELMKYVLEQSWAIPSVQHPWYNLWWPWLKNYHGELSPGYDNTYHFAKYVWIDYDLKDSMGY
jgi:peptide/nickel transport system substrate-binding protein